MKKVYVIVSQTQTVVGRAIRSFTQKTYNHASISFDESLEEVYGFGRTIVWNMFSATLIKERMVNHPHYDGTDFIIMSYEVTDLEYNIMKDRVEEMYENNHYIFNYIGMLGYPVGKTIRMRNQYNCSQYVVYIFSLINVDILGKEFNNVLPMDFTCDARFEKEYEGPIIEYYLRQQANHMII